MTTAVRAQSPGALHLARGGVLILPAGRLVSGGLAGLLCRVLDRNEFYYLLEDEEQS